MKLITRDTDYAIRSLCHIAKNKNEIISVRELVRKLKIPRPFLRKILQILSKNKLVRSSRGLGGGFILSVPADEIFLLDLIKVFQGQFRLSECLFKKEVCPHTKICALKRKIDKIEKYVIKELRSVSISYLLR
jgi:Rrf2 family protein